MPSPDPPFDPDITRIARQFRHDLAAIAEEQQTLIWRETLRRMVAEANRGPWWKRAFSQVRRTPSTRPAPAPEPQPNNEVIDTSFRVIEADPPASRPSAK